MKTKTCPRCGETKLLDGFYKSGQSFSRWCKECAKQWSRDQAKNGYFKNRRKRLSNRKDKRPSVLTDMERVSYSIWSNCRKRSYRNGIDFDLDREYITDMVKDFCTREYVVLGGHSPFMPSLDRVDPSKGYIKTNVRIIWLIENYAKHLFNDNDVLEFCKRKLGIYEAEEQS